MIAALLQLCLVFTSRVESGLAVGSEIGFPPGADVDAMGHPVGYSVDL